jgi:hypothetical protein
MHMRTVVSQIHHMGKVENIETLKAPPLREVRALARSPEIYLTLRRYRGDIPSTNLTRPRA